MLYETAEVLGLETGVCLERSLSDAWKPDQLQRQSGHVRDLRALLQGVTDMSEYCKNCAALADELNEQARVNGMGGSREAALLAKIATLEATVQAVRDCFMNTLGGNQVLNVDKLKYVLGSTAETPARQVHSKSEYKRLTALGVECVVTEKETNCVDLTKGQDHG